MKCQDVIQLILSGVELSEDMADHVDGCAECRALQDAAGQLDADGRAERREDLSRAAIQRVLSEAREITAQRVSPPHTKMREWWFVRRMAAAAALVLVAGIGLVAIHRLMTGGETVDMPKVTALLETEQGMDELRTEVRRGVARFVQRHRADASASAMDADRAALRARLAVATIGLERELSGLL